jgi:hypothetical protein
LALPTDQPTPRSAIPRLTPDLAAAYARREPKTVSHDINRLAHLGLISGNARTGYTPNIEVMDGFVPPTHRVRGSVIRSEGAPRVGR